MVERAKNSEPKTIDRLAQWSLSANPAYRSKLVFDQAKLLVLDSIGCAFAAIGDRAMHGVVRMAQELGGNPNATIIGSRTKTSVLNAVLVNGALVRVLDLNDIMFAERNGHLNIGGHRSDNLSLIHI